MPSEGLNITFLIGGDALGVVVFISNLVYVVSRPTPSKGQAWAWKYLRNSHHVSDNISDQVNFLISDEVPDLFSKQISDQVC